MKNRAQNISGILLKIAFAVLFFICAFSRCAIQQAPLGGAYDTLPPIVVNMRPADGTKNFTDRRIYIEFDEYVQIKDLATEFYTSPFMNRKPTVTLRGRGIQIDIQDTLLPNQTYSLNFGSSIQDNNEGNPLHGLHYVFSTGPQIDSLAMSGYTVDALKGDTVARAYIMFFAAEKDSQPAYDSTLFNHKADAVGRSEPNGVFFARNLKPVDYRVYAMLDANNNMTYDPGTDMVGFTDSIYNPADMPGFDVWFDPIRMYFTAEPQIYFRLFTDEPFRRQILRSQTRPQQSKAVLTFGAPYPKIESLTFEGIDPEAIIVENLKPTRDSVAYWFNLPPEQLPDTIRGEIVYEQHDSVRNLETATQPLTLTWRAPVETREQERERNRREREAEQAAREGRTLPAEPNPFGYTVTAPPTFKPTDKLSIEFNYPLVEMDSSALELTVSYGDVMEMPAEATITQDTLNIRKWIIDTVWEPDLTYKFVLPAGMLTDMAGNSNDTIRRELTVANADKFASLQINVEGKTPDSEYILQLVSGSNVINEIAHARSGTYFMGYVDPGTVSLRIVEDDNRNGAWDTGNLVERRQPERVEIYSTQAGESTITTRAGWEESIDLDMNEIFAPVTRERLRQQIDRNDAEVRRKYQEALEKRSTEPQQGTTTQQSNSFNPRNLLGTGQ